MIAGWKLVPIDPTGKMTFVGQAMRYESRNSIGTIYDAMLAAAPVPPAPQFICDEDECSNVGKVVSPLVCDCHGNARCHPVEPAPQAAVDRVMTWQGRLHKTDPAAQHLSEASQALISTSHMKAEISDLRAINAPVLADLTDSQINAVMDNFRRGLDYPSRTLLHEFARAILVAARSQS